MAEHLNQPPADTSDSPHELRTPMFDRKRPCANCPFATDQAHLYGLSGARVQEILDAPAFQCHKTVNYEAYDDPEGRQGDTPQQCAGLMALLHAEGRPSQIMQVGERLGAFDPESLEMSRTFSSIDAFLEASGVTQKAEPETLRSSVSRARP